jgi:hypothetical protein
MPAGVVLCWGLAALMGWGYFRMPPERLRQALRRGGPPDPFMGRFLSTLSPDTLQAIILFLGIGFALYGLAVLTGNAP